MHQLPYLRLVDVNNLISVVYHKGLIIVEYDLLQLREVFNELQIILVTIDPDNLRDQVYLFELVVGAV